MIANNIHTTEEKAIDYISNLIKNRDYDSLFYTDGATEKLRNLTNAQNILLTSSCTHALEMTALLLDLKQGDEVIMPSFTFVSTANAYVLRGATPVFVDIREDTLNIDEKLVEAAITENTKAIVAVHYAAIACDMLKLKKIAKKYGLALIEDAAQCIDSYYHGQHLGTFGDFGTLSFHYTKNITSGFGGALIINNDKYLEKSKIFWQKGTNREAFLGGQADKYTWVDVGSSYMMSELNAALLFAELEDVKNITQKRLEVWNQYFDAFKNTQYGFRLPIVPDGCKHNGHIFYLLASSAYKKNQLIQQFKKRGLDAKFHYQPLHLSEKGIVFSKTNSNLMITEKLANLLVRLPIPGNISSINFADLLRNVYELTPATGIPI
ncbi:MAG: dTDP-4-amino-4,6-dideoxygalactose transaminase [Gammaproteobacteria bacterium RIFCSPHIGHO2_12_FULL_40_19]|nr:MAG: dTDP-4-amino-4,6-dideoxygalactose transaminase [Gammaproteobacteria bacterium RIFCSPHIGHO2_12_FULL_40_19]